MAAEQHVLNWTCTNGLNISLYPLLVFRLRFAASSVGWCRFLHIRDGSALKRDIFAGSMHGIFGMKTCQFFSKHVDGKCQDSFMYMCTEGGEPHWADVQSFL